MLQDINNIIADENEHETSQLADRLVSLKGVDFDQASASLWIVHRKLIKAKAQYSAFKVDIEESLRRKLAGSVKRNVDTSQQVRPYEYLTEDMDGCLLEQPTHTTDFDEIISLVNRNGEDFKVEQRQQLVNAWGYIIKIQTSEHFVYAFRQIGNAWSSQNTKKNNWIFKNRILLDLDEEPVFRADGKIDFIAFEGSVFILDKNNFEKAINFREGMERHRDEILAEFKEIDLVSDIEVIKKVVGNNLHKLRKLASVKNSGYYKLPWYIERLKQINDKSGWGVNISDSGVIEVTEGNVDLVLTLLNNNRLSSPITDEVFDVPIKRPVNA